MFPGRWIAFGFYGDRLSKALFVLEHICPVGLSLASSNTGKDPWRQFDQGFIFPWNWNNRMECPTTVVIRTITGHSLRDFSSGLGLGVILGQIFGDNLSRDASVIGIIGTTGWSVQLQLSLEPSGTDSGWRFIHRLYLSNGFLL